MKSAKNSKGKSAKSSKEPTFHYGFILRAYPSFQQMAMIEKNINAARFYYATKRTTRVVRPTFL